MSRHPVSTLTLLGLVLATACVETPEPEPVTSSIQGTDASDAVEPSHGPTTEPAPEPSGDVAPGEDPAPPPTTEHPPSDEPTDNPGDHPSDEPTPPPAGDDEPGGLGAPAPISLPASLTFDIAPADDVDCFVFEAPGRGGLVAAPRDEEGECLGSGLRMRLYDEEGESVANALALASSPCPTLEAAVEGGATYTLCAERSFWFSSELPDRRVDVDFLPAVDNATCETAAPVALEEGALVALSSHTFATGQAWYRLEAEAARDVELKLATTTRSFAGALRVLDACGGTELATAAAGTMRLPALDGAAWLVVEGDDDDDVGRFELTASSPAQVAPGDTCEDAPALPFASGALTANASALGDDYAPDPLCGGAGTFDCGPTSSLADAVFRFELEPGQQLRAHVDSLDPDADEMLYVLSGDECGTSACFAIADETVGGQAGQPGGETVSVTNDGDGPASYLLVIDACDTIAPVAGPFVLQWQTD
jgi:hypothetical protein